MDLFQKNKDTVITILNDIFIFKNIPPLGNNDLVIHIRSGDIFRGTGAHIGYLSPPLSYFKNIIEQNNYDNIYLVAEDTVNPCINRLLELYPRIIFKIQTLEQDIKLILAATNIVISIGTFIPELLNLSNNIKNIYRPSYVYCNKPDCKIHITDLNEYKKSMLPWKNTPKQHEIMVNYNC